MSRTGICGNEKDSDVLVTVDLDHSGVDITLDSKLKKMFGPLMVQAVRDALAELGLENAAVTVKDFGALDFAIRARVKTAVKRAQRGGDGKC